MEKNEFYSEYSKLKIEMTPSERMSAYLKGEEVDCLPYGWVAPRAALANLWGITREEIRNSFEASAEVIKRMRDCYGLTGISCPLGMNGIGEASGSVTEYKFGNYEYVSEYALNNGYSNLPHIRELVVEKNPFLKSKLEYALRMKDRYPEMSFSTDVSGPFSTAISMRPIESLMRDIILDPDKVRELLAFCVDASLDWVRYFHRNTGCTSVTIADPVTTTDIIGKRFFDDFTRPEFKRLFDGITEITGRKPKAHLCGHTSQLWDDLIDMGLENLSFDNCESMKEAAERLGNSMFIAGNVGTVDVMRDGSIDDVIEDVKRCIREGSGAAHGVMICTGCQLPIGTPQENIDAFIYAVHKYSAGARIGKRRNDGNY